MGYLESNNKRLQNRYKYDLPVDQKSGKAKTEPFPPTIFSLSN